MNFNETCACAPSPIMKSPLTARAEESLNEILMDIENIIPEIASHSYVIKAKIVGPEPCDPNDSCRSECLVSRLQDIRSQLRSINGTLTEANASL